MKNYVSLLLTLVLMSLFCISASAAEVDDFEDTEWLSSEILTLIDPIYPTLEEYDNMVLNYPEGNFKWITVDGVSQKFDFVFDSHILYLYDNNGTYYGIFWDSSYLTVSLQNQGSYSNLVKSEMFPYFIYRWDNENNSWVFKNANSYKMSQIRSDFLIYTDVDIPEYNSDKLVYEKETSIGVNIPKWQTLNWNNTFRDLPKTMTSEIVGILPVVLSVLIIVFGVYKGIKFLFVVLRSS